MTDDEAKSPFLETLDEMTWWMYDNTCIGMGAVRQFDYTMEGSLGRDLSPRLGRCYELAVKAFVGWDEARHTWWTGSPSDDLTLPSPVTLVHGTWVDPDHVLLQDKHRIGHAWVELSDGYIWEPITGLICEPTLFHAFGSTVDVETYSETAARINMVRSQHFGPWHAVDEKGCPR
jgi:hypothetical protein